MLYARPPKLWRRRALCDLSVIKGGGGGIERRQLNCFLTRNHAGKGKKTSGRIQLRPLHAVTENA
jgi:hypothetical protein